MIFEPESLREIVGSFYFVQTRKNQLALWRQEGFIERRNYYDESYQKLYEETYYLGRQL